MNNRIKEFRKANGVTQEDLANTLEVTRQTIISLENGKYNASLQLAYKIAKYFNVTIEEIFIFEENWLWTIKKNWKSDFILEYLI